MHWTLGTSLVNWSLSGPFMLPLGRVGPVRAQIGVNFAAVGWFRRFRPPSSGLVPCLSAFVFFRPVPFQGLPALGQVCCVGVCSFRFLLRFRPRVPVTDKHVSFPSHFIHFQFFPLPFPFDLRVCVCVSTISVDVKLLPVDFVCPMFETFSFLHCWTFVPELSMADHFMARERCTTDRHCPTKTLSARGNLESDEIHIPAIHSRFM